VLGFGRFISHLLKINSLEWPVLLAFGTVFFSVVAGLFGHLGLIGESSHPLFWILTDVGVLLLLARGEFPRFGINFERDELRLGRVLVVVIAAEILFKLIRAQIPWPNSDPLFYQLHGPRIWADEGRIYFPSESPLVYLASFWEYLHIFSIRLLSGRTGAGVIEAQIFGQNLHVIFGLFATSLAVYSLVRKVFGLSRIPALVCVLSSITMIDILRVAHLAKNDWGVIFWILSGILLIWTARKESGLVRAYAVGGFILGIAAGAKFTNLVFIAIFGLALFLPRLVKDRTTWFPFSFCLFSLVLGILPYWLRNVAATGNPFFPYLCDYFLSASKIAQLNPGLLEQQRYFQNTADPAASGIDFLSSILMLFRSPVLILFPFLFLFALWRTLRSKAATPWTVLFLSAGMSWIIFAMLKTRGEIRHWGVILIILGMCVPIELMSLLKLSPVRQRWFLIWYSVLVFVTGSALINDHMPLLETSRLIANYPGASNFILSHTGGLPKSWIRKNIAKGAKIIVVDDLEHFYLPGYKVASFEMAAEFSKFYRKGIDPFLILDRAFSEGGYEYLLDVGYPNTRSSFSYQLDAIVTKFPSVLRYRNGESRVIDLKLLHNCLDGRPCAAL